MTKKTGNEESEAVPVEQKSNESPENSADEMASGEEYSSGEDPVGKQAGSQFDGPEVITANVAEEVMETSDKTIAPAAEVEEPKKEPMLPIDIPAMLTTGDPVAIHSRNGGGGYALVLAAQAGDLKQIEDLLEAGVNVNAAIAGPISALDLASQNGHEEVVRALLTAGADANGRTIERWTPVMKAAAWGHSEIIQLLLSSGAQINSVNKDGDTALNLATRKGHRHVAQILLENGARSSIQNSQGKTALYYAVKLGNFYIADLIRNASRQ